MVLRDLTSSIDQARKAANDPHSHLYNRADGVKNEVGHIVIERTSHLVGSYMCLVLDQVDSSLWNCSLNFAHDFWRSQLSSLSL